MLVTHLIQVNTTVFSKHLFALKHSPPPLVVFGSGGDRELQEERLSSSNLHLIILGGERRRDSTPLPCSLTRSLGAIHAKKPRRERKKLGYYLTSWIIVCILKGFGPPWPGSSCCTARAARRALLLLLLCNFCLQEGVLLFCSLVPSQEE